MMYIVPNIDTVHATRTECISCLQLVAQTGQKKSGNEQEHCTLTFECIHLFLMQQTTTI